MYSILLCNVYCNVAVPDASTAVDYKRGYVMRKSCYDAHGKRTKIGKRGWKMFYLTLRDMSLYCFKVLRWQMKVVVSHVYWILHYAMPSTHHDVFNHEKGVDDS